MSDVVTYNNNNDGRADGAKGEKEGKKKEKKEREGERGRGEQTRSDQTADASHCAFFFVRE